MVKFNVKVDAGGLAEKLSSRQRDASRVLEEAVLSSCEPFVPYRTGKIMQIRSCGRGRACYMGGGLCTRLLLCEPYFQQKGTSPGMCEVV